jgi:glycine/D-amino acid oxidase-like deaminating enzyme
VNATPRYRGGTSTAIDGEIMRAVICGGGVIGSCVAYYLTRLGIDVVIVEQVEVAAAASGKAGGFLALDRCGGTPLDALARRSFQLHAALPRELAGDWGYQRMTAYKGFVIPDQDSRRYAAAKLDWLSDDVVVAHRLGTPETTAIVHPRKFTSAIMSAAQRHGAGAERN